MNGVARTNKADSEATRWAVRLDADNLTETETEALENWLAQDPRNVGALVRAQAVWASVDRLRAMGMRASSVPAKPRPLARHWIAAAATLLIAVAGWNAFSFFHGRFTTSHSEVRQVALEDGSIVTLNSDSVVKVDYQGNVRSVYLESGEASFKVAHNKARPFVVHAGNLLVRAVGTKFTVKLKEGEDVSVVVDEGAVEVKRADQSRPAKKLARDQELIAKKSYPMVVASVDPHELMRRLSWERGWLIFDGETLAEAAERVNRYTDEPVVIDDDRLAERSFVGAFRIGDGKAFAQSAAAAYDATVREEGGAIHLTRQ
ncbi:MAG: FecR domain-containing protein [Rhizomicrobium sp.]